MLKESEARSVASKRSFNSNYRTAARAGTLFAVATNFLLTSLENGRFTVPNKPEYYLYIGGVLAVTEVAAEMHLRRIEDKVRQDLDITASQHDHCTDSFEEASTQNRFVLIDQSSNHQPDVR